MIIFTLFLVGIAFLILAFWFFARARECYINNIETRCDIYSMLSTFVGFLLITYGVLKI